MSFGFVRPRHQWDFFQSSSVELVDPRPVLLAPEIKQFPIPGAFPIHHAMQVGTGYLKVLHRMLIAQMSEMIGIDQVEHTFFAAACHEVLSWNQGSSRRIEVIVLLVQLKMVGRSEPVEHLHPGIEFDEAFTELSCTVPTAIPRRKIDVALTVHCGSLSRLPNARALSTRRCIEYSNLLQGGRVVSQQKPVIRPLIA